MAIESTERLADDLSLVASGVTKSFDGNVALDSFSLRLSKGEVHALVGHNGSGKSTFIKVLAGFHTPDAGEVSVGERKLIFGDPKSSLDVGLSFVHQTLGLVPELSVFENLHLGKPYAVNAIGIVRRELEYARARQALEQWGLALDPHVEVARLSSIERVEVALARALNSQDSISCVVLDEPTAALAQAEIDRLFAAIRRIKSSGVSVIYVSHRLDELPLIADAVSVLRDGQLVARGSIAEFDSRRLVGLIAASIGETQKEQPKLTVAPGVTDTPRALLQITDLRGEILAGINLEASSGEILGVFGLAGSGVEELVATLAGRSVPRSGTLAVDGREVRLGDVASLSRHGLRMIIGEKTERVIPTLTLAENATLAVLQRYFTRGTLRLRSLATRARQVLHLFGVNPAIPALFAGSLSGGNQQKLALARVVQGQPAVLVLERPFEGVDVGGRRELAALLRGECDQGRAVLLVDTDVEELLGLCDTITVLHEGAVSLRARGSSMKKSLIIEACYGGGMSPA
jgi:ribose transport system ATP-binding protein